MDFETEPTVPLDLTAIDAGGFSVTQAFIIDVTNINEAPLFASIGSKNVRETGTLTFTASAIDIDTPASALTYSLSAEAPTGAGIDSSTGEFTWTPSESEGPGTFMFEVTVSDGELTDAQSVTVIVDEVNTAPALLAIDAKTIDEGSELKFTAVATDMDLPAATLIYSLGETAPRAQALTRLPASSLGHQRSRKVQERLRLA